MSAVNHSTEFRSDIEGLRAVAVLLVVACHCGISWCSGGFIGVDVFFVLSGYLITGLLVAEIRRTSKVDLPRFYARRARRLLPALLWVLLATLAAGLVIQVPQELNVAARAARATALYVSNVFFDHNAADYFAPDGASNPFLHTWSLGGAVLPLLAGIAHSRTAHWGINSGVGCALDGSDDPIARLLHMVDV